MASGTVGLLAAFAAGLVSFVTPCCLPLVPGYISFVTGLSLGELGAGERRTWDVLGPILLFVAGFTVVFVALGASASVLGAVLAQYRGLLTKVAGAVVFLFGLVLLDVLPVPWLRRGTHVDPARARGFGRLSAVALGVVFPFALGPCAAPIYGAILTLAVDSAQVGRGALLLLVYSLGLAVPFVLIGLLFGRLAGRLHWFARHARAIDRVAGAILMVVGVLVFTGLIERATAWLARVVPFTGL